MEKEFRIQIRAYGYYVDFIVKSKDDKEAIEKAILDKVGQKDVKWESTGMYKQPRRITYEEVINDTRPIHYKEVLGVRVATGAPEGREA